MSGLQQQSESEDELDALLQHYERQAAADVAAVQQQQGGGVQKKQKLSAAERREEALNKPIAADNKGFKLLAAMGYKQGQKIGKAGTGLADPLPLLLKQDKLGLGAQSKKAAAREAAKQREREAQQRAEAAAAAAEVARQGQRQDFQQRAAAAAAARKTEGQLRKAQQVCETLDTAAGIHDNVLWALPPAAAAGAACAAAQAAAAAADDLLEQCEPCHKAEAGAAIRAAREEAADCSRLFAAHAEAAAAAGAATGAATGAGNRDASMEPPAADRQPGGGTAGVVFEDEDEQQRLQDWEAFHALPAAERLAQLLAYLRDRHCYCLFCGCRYEDPPDMQQHCPGPSEADHE